MEQVKRLPFVPLPVEGEWFPSWVDRCAADLDISPALMAQSLGLEMQAGAQSICRPSFYGILLTPTSRQHTMTATGLPGDALDAMQLLTFDGVALDLSVINPLDHHTVRKAAQQRWFTAYASRACPHCLDEAPVWPLWWQLSIAAVCPRHRVLLRSTCDGCGHELRSGTSSQSNGLSTCRLPAAGRCTNRRRNTFCELLLTTPTRRASAVEVEAQSVVAAVLARGVGPAASEEIPAIQWFGLLESLVALVRRATALDLGTSNLSYRRAPSTADEAALLLTSCVPALVSATLPEQLVRLARTEKFPDMLRTAGFPGHVVTAWTTHAGRRVRAAVGRELLRSGEVVLPLDCIPQLLPAAHYEENISNFLPGTAPATGRAFASMAVARLAGATSWKQAGVALDLPPDRAVRIADVVVRRVNDGAAFWAEAHRVAVVLAEDGIDFAARRRWCSGLEALPADAWRAITARHGVVPTEAGRRNAAIWVCEHVAGNHPQLAVSSRVSAGFRESRREVYRRFCTRMPAAVLADLHDWALAQLNEKDSL